MHHADTGCNSIKRCRELHLLSVNKDFSLVAAGFMDVLGTEENLHKCNVLKINDEEIIVVADLFGLDASDLKGCCKALLKKYKLRMAILTCGAVGSYAVNEAGEESWLDTPKVEVVDTVGAGDAFTGAFVAAILRGKSLKEAHALAVKVSAYVCTKAGAMPVLPEEIKII